MPQDTAPCSGNEGDANDFSCKPHPISGQPGRPRLKFPCQGTGGNNNRTFFRYSGSPAPRSAGIVCAGERNRQQPNPTTEHSNADKVHPNSGCTPCTRQQHSIAGVPPGWQPHVQQNKTPIYANFNSNRITHSIKRNYANLPPAITGFGHSYPQQAVRLTACCA